LRWRDRTHETLLAGVLIATVARRLGKLGRSAQRTPPDDGRLWVAADPPPRAGIESLCIAWVTTRSRPR
jgi:hypothetical protein